jgi:hypothetical protein
VSRRLTGLLLCAALLALAGCGDRDRGKNREQKDRPKMAPDKAAWVGPQRAVSG